jgi:hypothetical protein
VPSYGKPEPNKRDRPPRWFPGKSCVNTAFESNAKGVAKLTYSDRTNLQIDQDLHPGPRTFALDVLPALLSTYLPAQARQFIQRFKLAALFQSGSSFDQWWSSLLERFNFARFLSVSLAGTPLMTTQIHTQDAIRTLTNAFAPMNCLIMAARKGCFSFTLVNEHGIARHSERLYPDQYSSAEPLQAVIERTRQALVA